MRYFLSAYTTPNIYIVVKYPFRWFFFHFLFRTRVYPFKTHVDFYMRVVGGGRRTFMYTFLYTLYVTTTATPQRRRRRLLEFEWILLCTRVCVFLNTAALQKKKKRPTLGCTRVRWIDVAGGGGRLLKTHLAITDRR